MKKFFCLTVLAMTMLPLIAFAAAVPPLPKGYANWNKSVRKVVTDKNSLFFGIHYIYADKKAQQGYKDGNKFPEGSTIIVDYFNIKKDSSADGDRNMTVMMRKDKRKKETGGWLFAGYGADGKPSNLDPVSTCFSCHKNDAAKQDFVISTVKDFKP